MQSCEVKVVGRQPLEESTGGKTPEGRNFGA